MFVVMNENECIVNEHTFISGLLNILLRKEILTFKK